MDRRGCQPVTVRPAARAIAVVLDVADERQASLLPSAIEEVLRWHGPTQAIVRIVVEDAELAGRRFTTGDVIYPVLGAANRDPSRWPDPARFDIMREFKPNLGFGFGVHICLGAALVRLETRLALEALLRVAPEYHLRDLEWARAFFAHGPQQGVIEVRALAKS